ncbi:Cellulosome-anchoring protein precursor [Paenibacillus konkukensis]|uniref:Cellulosome-anchoring protein n=1 Tax=Paenibacillus konkukensis TaxID=2020716 RepID=A0ABY4RT40_9BACL|nr:S-layer homology domain-containing protein [Paenibacillus konkukensis]UQZ84562.1 Cellulosome-anchoring protein precursor [Paenibacillus konkukensis]
MNKKKLASVLMAGVLTIALAGQAISAPIEYGEELKNAPQSTPYVSFTDLQQSHWAYNYIANMVQKKVLEGYVDNKFRPENTITRAEFATIIVKASGIKPAKVNYASFSDVSVTNWASPFVESVKDYMTGYRLANGQYNFNPDTPATREDITVAIVKLKGYDARLANRAAVEPMFKDFESISESAKDYVAIAVKEGLVSGYPDETFRGQATITRAEASALLYRAFLYGNDNKGVGGQGGSSTTPTAPVTQPPTNPPTSTIQPQQPTKAAKFSVDTLVGGTGAGDVDGPVSVAKIKYVDSMALDKDDNVYFLDSSSKKVRKFNKSNGTVETLILRDPEIGTKYQLNDSKYQNLKYNPASSKMYLTVYSKYNYSAIYEINPTVTTATYYIGFDNSFTSPYNFDNFRFLTFTDANNLISGSSNHSGSALIIKSKTDGTEATILGKSNENSIPYIGYNFYTHHYSTIDSIATSDDIWILDAYEKSLTKIHVFPRKIETIKKFENLAFDTITTYNGKFYTSIGGTIYEIGLDGQISIFIDGKDLTYNDGNPIMKISHLSFDSKGNVILYDGNNNAIRRINL